MSNTAIAIRIIEIRPIIDSMSIFLFNRRERGGGAEDTEISNLWALQLGFIFIFINHSLYSIF